MAASIRKRGRSYYAYWREDGKLRQVVVGRDYHLAKIKRGEIEQRLLAKKHGLPYEIEWNEFKNKYFTFSAANHAPQTIIRNQIIFRNIEKTLGFRKISELKPQMLEMYKTARRSDGIQVSTLNRELAVIKAAMKMASSWGYVTPNIKVVRQVPTVKKHPVFFTVNDIQALLSKGEELWKTIIYLGVYAGLRRGEILHLEWADLDFEKHFLYVTPRDNWHPKNRRAREVPVHPELEARLLEWRRLIPDAIRVVPWSQRQSILSRSFLRLRTRAGLERGTLHSLRHSFASHLAMGGVDLLKIGKMMGHASVRTTQIYAHLLPSSLRAAVEKLPALEE